MTCPNKWALKLSSLYFCLTFTPCQCGCWFDTTKNMEICRYASESIRLACDYAYKDVRPESTLGGESEKKGKL